MAKQTGNVLAVVGAQYGSEGKGVIVSHLAKRFDMHVRVGGPNAGHSLIYAGQKYKMQALPCGWVNPNASLFIGRGALVNIPLLLQEIDMVRRVDRTITRRVFIDRKAGVLSQLFHDQEGGVHGEIHQRIGSTGEGVGAAREARMRRNPDDFCLIESVADRYADLGFLLSDLLVPSVSDIINTRLEEGEHCLLEGTQGSGLSLIHGPWPYVTSADTNAAQMAADIGLSPRLINRIMLVARSFPIRVAGNSGPLQDELTWEEMSKIVGKPIEERTTVTKKIRRVGRWDEDLFINAVKLNAPTSIAFTFADYLDPACEGKRTWSSLSSTVHQWVDYLEGLAGVPVALIGTGGSQWSVVDRGIAP